MESLLIKNRLSGTFRTRFWLEFLGNSAHFPLANSLFEILLEGAAYLHNPKSYVILISAAIQSYWLTRWQDTSQPRRFLGNLIGPALYTFIEVLTGGLDFFNSPNHLAYWLFSIVIGILQSLRLKSSHRLVDLIIALENMIRASILLVLYILFESSSKPDQATSISLFFVDPSHRFIALSILFLGFMVGLSNLTAERYLSLLRETSQQLVKYSEWLLGHDLLEKSFTNPAALSLSQRERVVLFMDIRGFTRWSERQNLANVARMLNGYYQLSESILSQHQAIKFKLSADEVMAVFSTVDIAVQAALELKQQVNQWLAHEQISVGIGLHSGLLIEGLLGSAGARFYDVIGDTVNTAKRIESAAQASEVLVSADVCHHVGQIASISSQREITVKGKKDPLVVYTLEPHTLDNPSPPAPLPRGEGS
ncbi:MAG: adenylate/guanylate cyclase domain-containing protein [Leptolyngbya sp.]|nr:adenylate/guanylate cyclase domain-containing protein [Leptolyngbya sp.]